VSSLGTRGDVSQLHQQLHGNSRGRCDGSTVGLGGNALFQPGDCVPCLPVVYIYHGASFFFAAKRLSNQCVETSSLVRAQAMMTQLVFEHALRIRIKTATGSGASDKGERGFANIAGVKGGSRKAGEKSDDNIVGKINTLIGTDLENIINGRDFLMLSEWQIGLVRISFSPPSVWLSPLQCIISVYFLYLLLGWRFVFASYTAVRY
jgi:hypothetical protein